MTKAPTPPSLAEEIDAMIEHLNSHSDDPYWPQTCYEADAAALLLRCKAALVESGRDAERYKSRRKVWLQIHTTGSADGYDWESDKLVEYDADAALAASEKEG